MRKATRAGIRTVQQTMAMVLMLFAVGTEAEAVEREVSLASGEESQSVPAGPLTVKITNLAPKNVYTVSWLVGEEVIPPLEFDRTRLMGSAVANQPRACPDLVNALEAATAETAEIKMPAHRDALKAELAKVSSEDCPEPVSEASRLLDGIVRVVSVDALKRGQQLTIEVVRLKSATVDKAKWTFVFRAPGRGRWVTSYGLAGIYNRSEIYFSRLDAAANAYEVGERRPDGKFDALGVVAFSWLAESRRSFLGGEWGATAGVGWDGSKPAVYIGPSLTWGDNVTLTLGVGLGSETRKDGRFEPGDPLPVALSEDDLNNEHYDVGVLFALTFRTGAKLEPPPATAAVEPKEPKLALSFTKAGSPAAGAEFDASAVVTNGGNGVAKSLTLVLKVPTALNPPDLTAPRAWECEEKGDSKTCTLAFGDLGAGKTFTVPLKLKATAAGDYQVTFSATGENAKGELGEKDGKVTIAAGGLS